MQIIKPHSDLQQNEKLWGPAVCFWPGLQVMRMHPKVWKSLLWSAGNSFRSSKIKTLEPGIPSWPLQEPTFFFYFLSPRTHFLPQCTTLDSLNAAGSMPLPLCLASSQSSSNLTHMPRISKQFPDMCNRPNECKLKPYMCTLYPALLHKLKLAERRKPDSTLWTKNRPGTPQEVALPEDNCSYPSSLKLIGNHIIQSNHSLYF